MRNILETEPIPEAEGIAAPPICCGKPENPTVISRHLEALKNVIRQKKEYIGHKYDYGIVYVGGGKYWPGIVVGCHLLRRSGYDGPIQVWHGHRASDEPVDVNDISGLDVEVINALEVAKISQPRILRGWESKLHALVQVPFRRVLYLDADAYCVTNPEPFFNLLDESPFRFWIDLDHTEKNVKWNYVWPTGANNVPQIQGGQLFIDREKSWNMLVVAYWLNMHSDYYYRYMFGDQDTWRVALSATNGEWKDLGRANWVSPAFVCSVRNIPLIIHRCRGKLYRVLDIPSNKRCYCGPNYNLPKESEVWDLMSQIDKESNASKVFSHIYKINLWGNGSGSGSADVEAQPYLDIISLLATIGNWRTVTDAGCGDCRVLFSLASRHSWEKIYGVDCVPSVFPENYIPSNVQLISGDITDINQLPSSDVLLVKDVLHHWPIYMIRQFLSAVIESRKWKWIVCTQDRFQKSEDCSLGSYRALDPNRSPLSEFSPWRVINYLHKALCVKDLRGV